MNVELSRVSFNFHNALPEEDRPYLRRDSEPFGVLVKISVVKPETFLIKKT